MEDLRFYDFEFNFFAIEQKYSSVCWHLRYNGTGTFECKLDISASSVTDIMQKKYIVVCQGEKQAIITTKNIEGNFLTLYGRTPSFILSKRVIPKITISDQSYGTTLGAILKNLALNAFSDVSNFIVTGENLLTVQRQKFQRYTAKPFYETVKESADLQDIGFRVNFDIDNERWVLEFYKGQEIDLSVSEGNKNAFETIYNEDMLDYGQCGYYCRQYTNAGDWNASTNTPALSDNDSANFGKMFYITEAGTQFGKQFKKGSYAVCKQKSGAIEPSDEPTDFWVYLANAECPTGIYRWETVLGGSDEQQAEESLATKNIDLNISCKTKKLVFSKDYNLGDVLKVRFERNGLKFTKNTRIKSIRIWNDRESGYGERPYFREEEE